MNLNASHGIKAKEPNWAPLEQRIGHHCADFMWMYARDGVEFYKHIGTRRYLCLNLTVVFFSAFRACCGPLSLTMRMQL
jgi:hypothetical protein